LQFTIVALNNQIIEDNQQCTQRLVQRENYFVSELDKLINMSNRLAQLAQPTVMMSRRIISNDDSIVVHQMQLPPPPTEIDIIITELTKLKTEIKQ
jgi:hypothetical protein